MSRERAVREALTENRVGGMGLVAIELAALNDRLETAPEQRRFLGDFKVGSKVWVQVEVSSRIDKDGEVRVVVERSPGVDESDYAYVNASAEARQ